MKLKTFAPQIVLLLGIVLIILTLIFGKSKFQIYQDLEVFGGRDQSPSHEKILVTEQRIKDEILFPIIIVESIGTVTLLYLRRKRKYDQT